MKTILALIVVVILAGGGWYLYQQNKPATPAPSNGTAVQGGTETVSDLPGGTDAGMEDGTSGSATATVNTQGYDALMAWGDTGFNPQTLTIQKGQTVRFLNQGTGNVWPASNVHPTHSLYPQKSASDCLGSSFDACRALKPGEHYDFAFDVVGTWQCHNHLRANQTCSIVVK